MKSLPCEVAVDYPLYQSCKGLYYIGQTPTMNSVGQNVLVLLYNPKDSDCLLFVNAITITNFTQTSLLAEFYLQSCYSQGTISNLVSCTNTALCPIPTPNGTIEYFETLPLTINSGVPIFSRIISPQSTLVVDGGQIILGPTQSLAVSVTGIASTTITGIRVAFGWSEDTMSHCN